MATPILPYGSQSPYRIQNELERDQKPPKKPRRWGLIIGATLLSFITIGVAGGAYYLTSLAHSVVTEGGDHTAVLSIDANNLKSVDASKFTSLGDGRFTMLLIGVDKAANLTDTLQLLSMDLVTNQATMVSIPRDLYVNVPGSGSMKINEVYNVGEKQKAGGGPVLLKQVVGSLFSTKVTNYAQVTFDGLKDLVDALGGITVDVTTPLSDPLFPAEKGDGYAPFSVKAGVQTMNGTTALKYARSRQTTSDFDRSRRQQIVIEAIRSKTLSAGVLANPITLSRLIDTAGKNFRTDLPLDDNVIKIVNAYNAVPAHKKQSLVLDTSAELNLLTSGRNDRGQYIIYPTLGQNIYTDIQRWYRAQNPDPLLANEGAKITVQRTAKATATQLTSFAKQLTDLGFSVTVSDTIATTKEAVNLTTGSSLIYSVKGNTKKITTNYLQTLLNTTAREGETSGTDFLLIYAGPATATSGSVKAKASPSPKVSPSSTPKTTQP
jgi:LCP family protein required for cell wall assembly